MGGNANTKQALKVAGEQRRISREELLKPTPVEEEIYLERLGGTVVIRSMSHALRQEVRQESKFGTEEFDEGHFAMLIIVKGVVDPKLSLEDVKDLVQQDASVIDELVVRITQLNAFGATGELGKASGRTRNSGSR